MIKSSGSHPYKICKICGGAGNKFGCFMFYIQLLYTVDYKINLYKLFQTYDYYKFDTAV